jgi:sugar phosphate isomerase/epimerase
MAQLGIVTYNIANNWDLPTILSRLEKLGYSGVELRTGHAHKVEVDLTAAQREDVRKRFEDSPVRLAGLGSAFEYHSNEPSVVRKNIEGTKEYIRLAHDVGSPSVKVRPNGLPRGADLEATLRQVGRALHEVGEAAAGFGIEIRVEVHGEVTQEPKHFARIIQYADHPNVYVLWNSNPTDVKQGSVKEAFDLLGPKIREVHLHDLFDEAYPYRELFALLAARHYEEFTLAELPESSDPERVLRYFKALWRSYQPIAAAR